MSNCPPHYWSARRQAYHRRALRTQTQRRRSSRQTNTAHKAEIAIFWHYLAQLRVWMEQTDRALARRTWLRPVTSGLEWFVGYGLLVLIMLFCVVFSPQGRELLRILVRPLSPLTELLPNPPLRSTELFASMESLGVLAIGHAEGNLTATGDRTSLYYGHTDPGNFRRNQGWCSDQGRGGGDPDRADQACLERVQQRMDLILTDLQAANIDPDRAPDVFVNMVDLYNQASPWVSRQFPQKYAQAKQQGKTGEDAIVWARVEAFRRNGRIDASGLIGICRREQRPVSDWDCVAQDQRRRTQAIERVLSLNLDQAKVQPTKPKPPGPYIMPAEGQISQGFHRYHSGLDIANAEGTIILAAAAGQVVFAGWHPEGLGHAVIIDHPDGSRTVYGHNSKLWVTPGQTIEQGQAIAEMGSTGNSTGPHLHFELYRQGQVVDPRQWLP